MPNTAKIGAECRLGRPPITNDSSREVLTENFLGNTISSRFPEGKQCVLSRSEHPNPCLLAVELHARLVHADNAGPTEVPQYLDVFIATGARRELDHV